VVKSFVGRPASSGAGILASLAFIRRESMTMRAAAGILASILTRLSAGVTLYAWCAWDTLFIPELLGRTARVESSCLETKKVRLSVAPPLVRSTITLSFF
jgi:hypothetical protein